MWKKGVLAYFIYYTSVCQKAEENQEKLQPI
jgi:hypothetical protein